MNISIFSDPAKIGPGMWFDIHIDGVTAITDALKQAFTININAKCDNFKCKKCQPHFREFINTHDFKNYWNIRDNKGRDIGFFKWTWELHNEVNARLGKYRPTLEEAYEFYTNPEVGACFNCGKSAPVKPIISPINQAQASSSEMPEQRSRAIPPILTLYRQNGITPQPFQLIPQS